MSDSTDDPAELEQLDASGLFDAAWYLVQYPDVRDAELEPLAHFYRFGWRERRKPNRYFDPEWYSGALSRRARGRHEPAAALYAPRRS